eukprot:CAMPEP_0117650440 /NCGR_PEP_ID=MMETSP0804-20121206/1540_1 /TAXON_ID=1074897 /ORGANISM="Tetraselmis astigmatica, Strain CCMP880" /LENGTH=55 /DNA_ID=CAMNT_0005456311 /DNA_START=417 /DNA_END=584 /DNA_ORIENTATION=+
MGSHCVPAGLTQPSPPVAQREPAAATSPPAGERRRQRTTSLQGSHPGSLEGSVWR